MFLEFFVYLYEDISIEIQLLFVLMTLELKLQGWLKFDFVIIINLLFT